MSRLIVPVNEKDHIQGDFRSPLTLVEYGDYQCSVCKLLVPIIKRLQNDLGNLSFIFRHFPLQQSHPFALMAAKTVEAASLQNKFWEMHNLLYKKQVEFQPDSWMLFASELQLDLEKFKTDLESAFILSKIETDFNTGIRSGVNGTPCLYINGNRYDGDASYETFKQALIKASQT